MIQVFLSVPLLIIHVLGWCW